MDKKRESFSGLVKKALFENFAEQIDEAIFNQLVSQNEMDKEKLLKAIFNYIEIAQFPIEHIRAIRDIVVLFNYSKSSEEDVFAFRKWLKSKYGKKIHIQNTKQSNSPE